MLKLIKTATLWLLTAGAALAWGPLEEAGDLTGAYVTAGGQFSGSGAPVEMATSAWTSGDNPAEIIRAGGEISGNGVVILDIRAPGDFAEGHIPGAVNTPYGLFRGPKENPGRVPEIGALQEVLRGAGAMLEDHVLIVHQGKDSTDFGAAARVYWTLKSAGFANLAILNGGFDAWIAEGLAVSTTPAETDPSDLTLAWSDTWNIDADAVADVVSGQSQAVLIDARPLDFFKGETKHGAAAAAGTLAGALNIVHSTWFGGDTPKVNAPPEMISQIQTIAAEHDGAPLVSFCNTGHWAATNWFAASELAGIEGVKLYPESMVGWTLLGNAVVKGQ